MCTSRCMLQRVLHGAFLVMRHVVQHIVMRGWMIDRCNWIRVANGDVKRFLANDQESIVQSIIEPMACNGLRTICLAYKNFVTGSCTYRDCLRVRTYVQPHACKLVIYNIICAM